MTTPETKSDGPAVLSSVELGAWQPIEKAPRDGTVIGGWNIKKPGVLMFVKWTHHLASKNQPKCWCTATHSIAVSHPPTHFVLLEAPYAAADAA